MRSVGIIHLHLQTCRSCKPVIFAGRIDVLYALGRHYLSLPFAVLCVPATLIAGRAPSVLPLMRPLVLNHASDPRTWELGTQYLWGDDLLVAPVTREGATAWPVYLPEGDWFDFWTGERHTGPGGVTLAAPLDRLPLLVRAGAILPLGPLVQHTGERATDELTLQVYPQGRSRFVPVAR